MHEGRYPVDELAGAEEAFTSSSIREVMPAIELDGKPVGDGRRHRRYGFGGEPYAHLVEVGLARRALPATGQVSIDLRNAGSVEQAGGCVCQFVHSQVSGHNEFLGLEGGSTGA